MARSSGGQLLKDAVAASLDHAHRQTLPGLIIRPG
jgi:hypothetical protein